MLPALAATHTPQQAAQYLELVALPPINEQRSPTGPHYSPSSPSYSYGSPAYTYTSDGTVTVVKPSHETTVVVEWVVGCVEMASRLGLAELEAEAAGLLGSKFFEWELQVCDGGPTAPGKLIHTGH